jgi:hypothetical protein
MNTTKVILGATLMLASTFAFGQKVEVANLKNPTIKTFISGLDGKDATAEKLIAKYGNAEVIDNGMIPSGKLIKVHSESSNCVVFSTLWVLDEDESEVMEYEICEKGGKIISFDMIYDEDED